MGPAMHFWVNLAAVIFPRTSFRSALSKAFSEQLTVDPTCILTFLFVMSLLERKTIAEAKEEVSHLSIYLIRTMCATNCFCFRYFFPFFFISCVCVFVLLIVRCFSFDSIPFDLSKFSFRFGINSLIHIKLVRFIG